MRDPESSPAAFLGAELRRARMAAGFASQDALSVRLGFDRTVITKAETGDRPPTAEVLDAWCEACGVDGGLFARLAALARRADGPVPTWFEDWLEAEREAHTLRIWSPVLVPGLLQTADYARALFMAAQADTSDDAIDALVAARMERQVIFERSRPPHTVVVIDELVLHRLVGSPQIMLDQMGQLSSMSEMSCISLQVVPSSSGANAGLSGAFDIASVDDLPGTLRMEGVEDQTTDKRSLVSKAAVTFDRIRADALPRVASRDLVERLAETLWKA